MYSVEVVVGGKGFGPASFTHVAPPSSDRWMLNPARSGGGLAYDQTRRTSTGRPVGTAYSGKTRGGLAPIVMQRSRSAAAAAQSAASTVKHHVPPALGVPAIAPLAASRARPSGS